MKLLFLLLFLSLSGNEPSEKEIPYRTLSWLDFRAPVPENEPTVAARTATQMEMETAETNGRSTFVVRVYFLPDSSFVRVRSDANLRHEQTHFQIACIEARRCMLGLVPLQKGDSLAKEKAFVLYEAHWAESGRRNEQFDQETNHSLNKEAEKIWEARISREWRIFENLSKPSHGRNQ